MPEIKYAEMSVHLPCGCRVARAWTVHPGEVASLADAASSLQLSLGAALAKHICPSTPKES